MVSTSRAKMSPSAYLIDRAGQRSYVNAEGGRSLGTLSATRRLANRVSLCSELSAARRSLRRSVLLSEFSAYLALSGTRRFANRVTLSPELSAARRSLLLRSALSGFQPYITLVRSLQSCSLGLTAPLQTRGNSLRNGRMERSVKLP